jgi:hypothetical protein
MPKMNGIYYRGCLWALALTFVIGQPAPASPGEVTVWQIGVFDQSSEEFGPSFEIIPTRGPRPDPIFRVGQSDGKKDWPGFQPGSANPDAGSRPHPFTVVFALDQPPRGLYKLTVSALLYRPHRPDLQVEVNGKKGLFYLRPRLTYERGDFSVLFLPHFSHQQLEIELPADYFKQGENRLSLTAADHPFDPNHPAAETDSGPSGLHYDALSLAQLSDAKFSSTEIRASLTPTVFYRPREGGLAEVVEAIVRLNRKAPNARVTLEINSDRYTATQSGANDFGEQAVEFEIPEWSGPASARLRVSAGATRDFNFTLEPQRKWTAFVVPHTHLDVGFTDYQGKVAEGQPRVITQAANLIQQHPDFRFSLDSSWSLEQFLETRSAEKRSEILELIRQGKMELPVQYVDLLTGYASLETELRSLYYSKSLARQYGLPFEVASIYDVPSYSGSYPSLLASAGVKYFLAAANNWRAPVIAHGRLNEKSPFWWEGPDGQKVLVWYSRSYMQVQAMFGLPPRLGAMRDALSVFLQAYSQPEYKADVVLIQGTQVENTDLVPETATFVGDWNRVYTYPRLRYATLRDFFKYVEEHYSAQLATYKGDGGAYWEDGPRTDARYAAESRQNEHRVLSAEILSTLTHQIDPSLHAPSTLLASIWQNILLFVEHTFASLISIDMPDHEQNVKQIEVKNHFATAARLQINELLERSLSQLSDRLHVPASTLVVFNSLNWRRNALVEFDLMKADAIIRDLSNGREVPFQILDKKQGYARVRFLAENLPPVGYKCYAIGDAPAAPAAAESAPGHATVVENSFYRLKLDAASGALSSLYDKELQRELVDSQSPYKFDQYLYVSGGDGPTRLIRALASMPEPALEIHPAQRGEILGVTRTPFGHSIRLRSRSLNTPSIQTEILLFDNEKKIEFINQVEKQPVLTKEGVYFAFPVAVEKPEFIYSLQTGVYNAARDLLPGANTEWFAVQYWMAARNDQFAVAVLPLDVPLACFGDINRGRWPAAFHPANSTLFSYVMNNYWDTNYPASQSGGTFRYVVTSGRNLEPQALTKLAWSHLRPVEVNYVTFQDKMGNPDRPLPAEGASFLQIDQPNVVLVTWKQAEDGNGTILRLLETAGHDTTAAIRFEHLTVDAAKLCNAVEDDLKDLRVEGNTLRVNLRANEVVTVRVQ